MDSSTEATSGLSSILEPVDRFCHQALERTGNIPGVEEVALVDWLPLLETPAYASPCGTECIDRFRETDRSQAVDQFQLFSPHGHSVVAGPRRDGAGHEE